MKKIFCDICGDEISIKDQQTISQNKAERGVSTGVKVAECAHMYDTCIACRTKLDKTEWKDVIKNKVSEACTEGREGQEKNRRSVEASLLPCPFCGAEIKWIEVITPYKHMFLGKEVTCGGASIECSCGIMMTGETEEEVIEAWNTRVVDEL